MTNSSVIKILIAGVALTAAAVHGAPPTAVSPRGLSADRCPTFSWSAAAKAAGYELLTYRVSQAGEVATEPILSVGLPGGAASWTPPGAGCLAAGGRYAWTLRVLGEDADGLWSEPALFEVASAPSVEEVEAAMATLRRYLADSRQGAERGEAAAAMAAEIVPAPTEPDGGARRGRTLEGSAEARGLSRAAESGLGSVTAPSVPVLGSPSFTVDANIALGAASNLFKGGSVFLWDDTTGNIALGRLALASSTAETEGNSAFGREALRYTVAGSYNTAIGDFALRSNTTGFANTASGARALFANTTGYHNTANGVYALRSNTTGFKNTANGLSALRSNTTGSRNTASGWRALFVNTTGFQNTASGYSALYFNRNGSSNTANGLAALVFNTSGSSNSANGAVALFSNRTGSYNTADGFAALFYNSTGSRNTAVGNRAGHKATTGSDNIYLGSGAEAVAAEGNTIRIGGATGTGEGKQNRAFIAGIRGTTTASADAITVLIDSSGQLGTTSSSREVKQDIREIGELSRPLLALRPVAFRYRQHVEEAPETPLQFGLVAEEVVEVFPELVVYDKDGRPETVKYHLLATLLLNELQRTERQLAEVQRRLAAVEGNQPARRPRARSR